VVWGDPQAAALLQQLADMGVNPEQAAEEIRRRRMTRSSANYAHSS
jgi:hypothetical protein